MQSLTLLLGVKSPLNKTCSKLVFCCSSRRVLSDCLLLEESEIQLQLASLQFSIVLVVGLNPSWYDDQWIRVSETMKNTVF